MIVLGIETSCDETAAAIIENGHPLSNIITTQNIHVEYGGIVPEFASREHIKKLFWTLDFALQRAGLKKSDIDGIAATHGPGLAGSLLVGLNVAKSMSFCLSIPWVGVNHIEGHIFAVHASMPGPEFPFLCLVVSGGHTMLVIIDGIGKYRVLGRTIDDAAGEAFDKVAKTLDLSYPGGPAIEATSLNGDPNSISFPRAMLGDDSLDFSFSGVKTSVLYYVKKLSPDELLKQKANIAASFQKAVIDVLISKTLKCAELYNIKNIVIAGGVARNSILRAHFNYESTKKGLHIYIPEASLCTDNAVMIAYVGYQYLKIKNQSPLDLGPHPTLNLPSN